MSEGGRRGEALERFVDRLERRGIERVDDPAETVGDARRDAPTAVSEALSAVLSNVESDGGDPGEGDLEPSAAMRELSVAFDECGRDVVAAAPDATWDVLVVATDRIGEDPPVGGYARALVHTVPGPETRRVPDEEKITASSVRERLADRSTRTAAATLCARKEIPPADDEQGGRSVPDVLADGLAADDAGVRAWSAKAFDYTDGVDLDPVADRLLAAVDDPDPRVRAAVVGALCHRLWLRDAVPSWADRAMAALAEAFVDDDDLVRTRAAGVVDCYPDHLAESELWHDALQPETRARVVLNAADVDVDATATDSATVHPARQIAALQPEDVRTHLDEFRARAWGPGEPDSLARSVLATAVEDDPRGVDDPEWYVEHVADPPVDRYGARILRALAPHYPEVVRDAVPALERTFEETGEERRWAAARAIAVLGRRTSEAVSLSRDDLLAGIPAVVQGGSVHRTRFVAMADVDPDRATDTLVEVCENVDDHVPGRISSSVEAIARWRPSVVTGALDEVVEILPEFSRFSRRRTLRGLVDAVTADAGEADADEADVSVDALADGLVRQLAEDDEDGRTDLEESLQALADSYPDAVGGAIASRYSTATEFARSGPGDVRPERRALADRLDLDSRSDGSRLLPGFLERLWR